MNERPHDDSHRSAWMRPAMVFVLALGVTGLLWGLQERSHRSRLHLETTVTAEQAGRRLSDWMQDRMSLSAVLAEKWESEYAAEPWRFERDAARFVEGFPSFQAINWVDPERRIRIVVPLEGNSSALNADLRAHPSADVRAALDRALKERRLARTTATIDLLQGGKGFATYRPIFASGGEHLGFINAVFRVNELVDACLGRMQVNQHFLFAIREMGGDLVYPVDAAPGYLLGPRSAVETLRIADQPWQFYLAPTAEYLRSRQYAAHHLLLPAGFFVALLLAGFERGRVQRKRALDISQIQFKDLFEKAPVAYFSVRTDTSIERANRVAESITGRGRAKLLDASIYDLLPQDNQARADARALIDTVRAGGQIRGAELTFRQPDGELVRTVLYIDGVYAGEGQLSSFRVAAIDVTERHEAEKARERLSAAIDQSEEGVVITDAAGGLLYINPAAAMGATHREGTRLGDLLRSGSADPAAVAEVEAAINGGTSWRGSCLIVPGEGPPIHVIASLSPVRDRGGMLNNFVFTQRDISYEAELQTQLQQAHKLEAVGRLAGGIAHDFNNILQSLLGYATLARRNTTNPAEVTMCLDEIERASHRAANLVAHILAFGRQSAVDRRALFLKPVVEEVAALVRGSLPEGVRLEVEISEEQYPVCADPTQIHQVLMNLASNALHALRGSGTLAIRFEAIALTESESARWPALKPGPHMRLTVKDSGVGMDAQTLSRIFEPYFSTREIGTGTGLGLATVHGIVENHSGVIFAESSPGHGASFTILLPAASPAGEETPPSDVAAPDDGDAQTPGEGNSRIRILYVDDEVQIVDSMRRILERLGFEVAGFTSSRAALASLQGEPERFDLLVTDLTMPELDGVALADAVSAIRPNLPVIFCSGYGDSFERSMEANPSSNRVFLRKPVSARTLSAEIQRLTATPQSME